jgi:hypothetical protein
MAMNHTGESNAKHARSRQANDMTGTCEVSAFCRASFELSCRTIAHIWLDSAIYVRVSLSRSCQLLDRVTTAPHHDRTQDNRLERIRPLTHKREPRNNGRGSLHVPIGSSRGDDLIDLRRIVSCDPVRIYSRRSCGQFMRTVRRLRLSRASIRLCGGLCQ